MLIFHLNSKLNMIYFNHDAITKLSCLETENLKDSKFNKKIYKTDIFQKDESNLYKYFVIIKLRTPTNFSLKVGYKNTPETQYIQKNTKTNII